MSIWKIVKKKKSKSSKYERFIWGIELEHLPTDLRNEVISNHFLGKLSEKSLNIYLKGVEDCFRGKIDSYEHIVWCKEKKEVITQLEWIKEYKETVSHKCIACDKELRIKYYDYKLDNFLCKNCKKKKKVFEPIKYLKNVERLTVVRKILFAQIKKKWFDINRKKESLLDWKKENIIEYRSNKHLIWRANTIKLIKEKKAREFIKKLYKKS